MHELACPTCNSQSQYNFHDYLLMCSFCSSTFKLDLESGRKIKFSEHYIVPNTLDARQVKELVLEWLRRLHHQPGAVNKEFFITDISGVSLPYWVVSMESHTLWKGLAQKKRVSRLDHIAGANYLYETGKFRRSYRWAVSGRTNLYESWGMVNLHVPKEAIKREWDGFPLDSTFSRGRLDETNVSKSAYEYREVFEFKYANGLPILGIEVDEEEALRRAKFHVELYHYKLSSLNVDTLIDIRTEHEIAGVQLIHLPFWQAKYIYRPHTMLRYMYKSKEKRVLLNGYSNGILEGEMPIIKTDKVSINTTISLGFAIGFLVMAATWHPAFYLASFFGLVIAAFSAYLGLRHKAEREAKALEGRSRALEEHGKIHESSSQVA